MEEFLFKNYSILTHVVEVMAALTGLFCLNKYKKSVISYFIYFLFYLTICEFLARYTRYVRPERVLEFLIGSRIEKNHWWATLFWKIGAIMFFSFYYQKIIKSHLFKGIIRYGSIAFLIFSLTFIGFNWNEFFYTFFPAISVFGAIIIFICVVFYFIEILQSDELLSFYKSVNFYISAAIFIWWLIITPIVFYDIYFTYEIGNDNRDWNFTFLRWQIYLFANIFMYSTFTFALIFCKPELNDD